MTELAPAATFLSLADDDLGQNGRRSGPVTSHVVGLGRDLLDELGPWFSKMSSSSISRAIVTPSLVIVGEPNFLSSTTYWPLGPSVILTASASLFTPASSARRASVLNLLFVRHYLPPLLN